MAQQEREEQICVCDGLRQDLAGMEARLSDLASEMDERQKRTIEELKKKSSKSFLIKFLLFTVFFYKKKLIEKFFLVSARNKSSNWSRFREARQRAWKRTKGRLKNSNDYWN